MLILASQSAARKALLLGAGLRFEARPAQIDERALESTGLGKAPRGLAVAQSLALAKAKAVSAAESGALVIGCDQTLTLDDRLFHKPDSMAEVRAQLLALRGRTHRLTSAICLVREGREIWAGFETADLTMRTFTEAELDRVIHIEGPSLLACVGAYRLEGASICLFERIEGDYFTILGLPLLPLLAALRQHAPETLESAAP